MKRIAALSLCLMMLIALAIPAMATPVVEFTANSKFEVGSTVTVDEQKTLNAIMDSDSITADLYNAALEHNVSYHWFKDDVYYSDGKSVVLTEQDRGSTFYCLMALYSDMDCTQQCGALESEKFTVPAPTIQPITEPSTMPETQPTTPSATLSTDLPAAESNNSNDQSGTPWGLVTLVIGVVLGALVFGFALGKKQK